MRRQELYIKRQWTRWIKISNWGAYDQGYYYSDLVSGKLIHAINKIEDEGNDVHTMNNLSERETDFLKYACTELTYKEIADKMFVSPRTIDGYRDVLFEKLHVKTR